jgi:hypothetical protein
MALDDRHGVSYRLEIFFGMALEWCDISLGYIRAVIWVEDGAYD